MTSPTEIDSDVVALFEQRRAEAVALAEAIGRKGDEMTREEKIAALKAAADALLVDMPPGMQERYQDVWHAIYDAIDVNLICHGCLTEPATVDRQIDGVWCARCDEQTDRYQPGPDEDCAYDEAAGK